ncbi:MAG: 16S rRNA (guanine(966)-N(2))-methyltransferase RsmD [Thermoanaerobaculia bacterium]|nr:16S rRNA (guanine(966)-N(2))-methyltransferase RsmD [Thermoanaerobaculia bacterium]
MTRHSRPGPGAVRIESGTLKGRSLAVPPGARPTEARVRGALFSIWAERLEGAHLLDLYSGSGAIGIEAISRGAFSATLVEGDRRAVAVLRQNLRLAPPGSARLLTRPAGEAMELLVAAGERFDLIFADPPYAAGLEVPVLQALEAIAAPGAELAIEHPRRSAAPDPGGRWVRREERRYGETALTFFGLSS